MEFREQTKAIVDIIDKKSFAKKVGAKIRIRISGEAIRVKDIACWVHNYTLKNLEVVKADYSGEIKDVILLATLKGETIKIMINPKYESYRYICKRRDNQCVVNIYRDVANELYKKFDRKEITVEEFEKLLLE